MNAPILTTPTKLKEVGEEMYQLMGELYPICRSITGEGVRQTLEIIKKHIPVTVHEVPSGAKVFDWTVPKEWNIKDAYVRNSKGEKIVDFKKSNLHVLHYSTPVSKKVTLEELKEHLFTIPEHPDWIPYRTSYYQENWGFCLSHKQFLELKDEVYEVFIDSSLKNGSLSYGELYINGKTSDEFLISCHVCHPSLCNDNLSGIVLNTFLARYLRNVSLRYSYRFLFIPGTIGSIAWLSLNEKNISKIKHGLVVAGLGDSGGFTYKKSRTGDAEIDRSVENVMNHFGNNYEITDFSPYGYDERQFCSPGFNLPIGCLMRTQYGKYMQYHTSADNLEFVRPEYLAESFSMFLSILNVIENNRKFVNMNPRCEPQLGKRGLYQAIGGDQARQEKQQALLWVLNLSDGENTLLDISEKSSLKFDVIKEAADLLNKYGLLEECSS
jgi:aminopeptidase-like protein